MRLLALLLAAYPLLGQTEIGSTTAAAGSTIDFSTASATRPMVTGTSLPSLCSVGSLFFKTDAVAGQNVYACTSTNTWTLSTGGGGGGGGAFSGITSGTNTTATMVVGTGASLAPTGSGTIAATTAAALAANPTGCTNQVVTDIAADGTLTCNSVSNAMITNSTIDLTAKVTGVLPNGNTTAASANTASAIVARDGSGNFSAGTITAALTGNVTGNASTATALAANPTDCSTGALANAIAANGNLTCATPATVSAVSHSATPTYSGDNGTIKTVTQTLSGNVTSCTLADFVAGQEFILELTQDGTGGRTFACASLTNLGTVSGVIDKVDVQVFRATSATAARAITPMWCVTCDAAIILPGSSSGTTTVIASAAASGVLALPAATATLTYTVASGSKALNTNIITSTNCDTTTEAATGVLSTDVVTVSFNGATAAVTGYAPLTTGGLSIRPYPSAGAVNFEVCNGTSGSITPGALTVNWGVRR